MPAPRNKTEVATEPQVVDTEKEQLRSEVEELKLLVQQMLQAQTVKNEEVVTLTESAKLNEDDQFFDIEEALNINPHQPIKIVSMVEGGLNLRGNSPQPIYLPEFGAVRTVAYEELRTIYYNQPELAREGAFFIVNKKAVQALYLEDEYQRILSKEKLEKIVDLPANEIVSVLKTATKTQRETIIQRFIKGIQSGDNRYSDFNKIHAINNFIEDNLLSLAGVDE